MCSQFFVLLLLYCLVFRGYQVFALESTSNVTSNVVNVSKRVPLDARGVFSTISTKYTVDYGSQVLRVINIGITEKVSLTGPTTFITTVTLDEENPDGFLAGSDPGDPHCSKTVNQSNCQHCLAYAEFYTILTGHQTITDTFEAGLIVNGYGQKKITSTFTGPSTVYVTYTTDLIHYYEEDSPSLAEVEAPGAVCGGMCGFCNLYFATVYVYYWPVASPNTACLSSRDSYLSHSSIQPRGLSNRTANISTHVIDNFTFVSPSAYIAFPTISAFDNCGILGSVHTSTTLAFAPGELSTRIFSGAGYSDYSFDFAYASCPPPSLAGSQYFSIIGQTGYNPIISPPQGLTLIDPAWNANCLVAPFQGNDPPRALQPASNLMPSTTSAEPEIVATPARPVQMPAGVLSPTASGPQASADRADPPTRSPASPGPAIISTPSPDNALGSGSTSPSDPQQSKSINASPTSLSGNTAPNVHQLGNKPPFAVPNLHLGPPSYDPLTLPGDSTDPDAQASKPPQLSGTTAILQDGRETVTAYALSHFHLISNILTPGRTIFETSNPISLVSSGSTGGKTTVPNTPITDITPTLVLGSQTLTANSASAVAIGSQALAPDGAIVVSSTPVSLPFHASYILQGTNTIPLIFTATSNIQLADKLYTIDSHSHIIVGTQTLTPGGKITISGTSLSFPVSASYILESKSTIPLDSIAANTLTLAGHAHTADTSSNFVVAGQTLTLGSVITVSRMSISLPATSTDVVSGPADEVRGGACGIRSGVGGLTGVGLGWGVVWMMFGL